MCKVGNVMDNFDKLPNWKMPVRVQTVADARSLHLVKPLAFFDLETTGTTVGLDRIVEIGVLKVTPHGEELELQTRINPGIRIPREATAVHGISDKDVEGKPTFDKVAPRVARFLEGCDFAGYNVLHFDLPILQAEFRRVDVPLDMKGREVIDAMSIYFQKEPRDLKAALRFYCGTEHANEHSAFADACACRNVLQGQIRMYADLPNTPEELSAVLMERTSEKTLDSGGWFETRHGQPAFARGRHQGILIQEVAQAAPDYLEWMLTIGLPQDTVEVIRSVIPNFGKKYTDGAAASEHL
jgi:DNA polymerase III subunit epsilon